MVILDIVVVVHSLQTEVISSEVAVQIGMAQLALKPPAIWPAAVVKPQLWVVVLHARRNCKWPPILTGQV